MEQAQKERISLFRFGVIHPLIGLKDSERIKQAQLIREICDREWEIPYSNRTHICRATILDWLKKYRASGDNLESLFPKDRSDTGRPRVMDDDTERALVNLKTGHPTASLPTLMKLAKSKGFLPPDFKAAPQTIYRIFQRHGLHVRSIKQEDCRKFQAEHPNDLWQSDCMHGPQVNDNGKLRKAYLFAIIDDHSRLICHAQFYFSENITAYAHCLQTAMEKRGLPRKLYLDNGAAFRSHHLRYVTASLGCALIHARPYRPQGKGKIERWFKTVQTSWLPLLPELMTLERINERLNQWIDRQYHVSIHSTIQTTPLQCYTKKLHLVRPAPKNLSDYFRCATKRKVNKDRTVSLYGVEYEAPLGLIGRTVTLRYHADDLTRIEVFAADRSCGFLSSLEPQINVHVKRETLVPNAPSAPVDIPIKHHKGGQLFKGEIIDEL